MRTATLWPRSRWNWFYVNCHNENSRRIDIYLRMSKNTERYNHHLEELDEDTLLELETESFEKFSSKKRNEKKQQPKRVTAEDNE